MGYGYEISYKKGRENVTVDVLSRIHSSELMTMAILAISFNLMSQIQLSWEVDQELMSLITQLQEGIVKDSPYTWSQGQLTRKGRVVVSKNIQLQLKIIGLFHKDCMRGHFRGTTTLKRLTTVFFWKGTQKQVRQFIRECEVCQRNKYEINASSGLLQPLSIP